MTPEVAKPTKKATLMCRFSLPLTKSSKGCILSIEPLQPGYQHPNDTKNGGGSHIRPLSGRLTIESMIFHSNYRSRNQRRNPNIIYHQPPSAGHHTNTSNFLHRRQVGEIRKRMPNGTTSQTLECRNKEHRTNKFIRRRRNLITRTARVPIHPHCQNKEKPKYMSPYISCFIMNLEDTVDTLHFILVKAVAAEDVRVIVPV